MEADRRKDEFLATLAHELRNPLAPIRTGLEILQERRRRRRGGGAGPPGDRPPDAAPGAADRRPARREPHHRQQARPAARAGELGESCTRRVETSRADHRAGPHALTLRLPPTRHRRARRRHPAHADRSPTCSERLEVHAARRPHPAEGAAPPTARSRFGSATTASASPRPTCRACSRSSRRSCPASKAAGAASASAWRWCAAWSRCTAAWSRCTARARDRAAIRRAPAADDRRRRRGRGTRRGREPPLEPSRRVLVVDDNVDNAAALALLSAAARTPGETAYDGEQACEAAERFRPDVVLLDIGLPKLDGHEVCQYIRLQPWGANIQIIAQTGWAENRPHAQPLGRLRRSPREAGRSPRLHRAHRPLRLMPLPLASMLNLMAA